MTSRSVNGVVTTLTVNDLNELTAGPDPGYTYDNNGNMTSKGRGSGTTSFVYDDENRLVRLTFAVYRTDFAYDGLSRLRVRTEYVSGSPTSTTRYIYDGKRVIQERDGSNAPTLAYARGQDLSGSLEGAGGIGGLLSRSTPYSGGSWSGHAFYHADGNGNVTAMANTGQAIVASYKYDPYGRTISSSGSLASANVYRFSSKEIHVNSGLYYYLYRFYDPNTQRWINRDPIGERGGVNLFDFVRNQPLSAYDRFGHVPIIPIGIGVAAGVGLGWCIDRLACNQWRNASLRLAESQADANAPDGSHHRGPGSAPGNDADLLTHCIAACDLARNPGPCGGPDGALNALQRREIGNDLGTQIDRLNNEAGVGIGISAQYAGQSCTTACLDALRRGLLSTINNGTIVPHIGE